MDENLRQLQRLAQSGDINAEARYLSKALQSGLISAENIELAAIFGHPASRILYPETVSIEEAIEEGILSYYLQLHYAYAIISCFVKHGYGLKLEKFVEQATIREILNTIHLVLTDPHYEERLLSGEEHPEDHFNLLFSYLDELHQLISIPPIYDAIYNGTHQISNAAPDEQTGVILISLSNLIVAVIAADPMSGRHLEDLYEVLVYVIPGNYTPHLSANPIAETHAGEDIMWIDAAYLTITQFVEGTVFWEDMQECITKYMTSVLLKDIRNNPDNLSQECYRCNKPIVVTKTCDECSGETDAVYCDDCVAKCSYCNGIFCFEGDFVKTTHKISGFEEQYFDPDSWGCLSPWLHNCKGFLGS